MAFIVIEFLPNNPTGKAVAIFNRSEDADFYQQQMALNPPTPGTTYQSMDTEELNASTIREYVIEIMATPD